MSRPVSSRDDVGPYCLEHLRGYVGDAVRHRVRSLAGREVPIVEADPDTLGDVVGGLIADRDAAAERAAAGPEFVAELHDGRRSAEVLSSWLTKKETL